MKERHFKLFDFHELLALPQLYEPEPYHFPPFWNFGSRFRSLQRFYHVNLILARQFVDESELSREQFDPAAEIPTDPEVVEFAEEFGIEFGSEVRKDLHFDMTAEDKDYYVGFLHAAVITQLFSSFETLCVECAEMLKTDLRIDTEPPAGGGRLVDRCLEWMSKRARCTVELEGSTWRTFNLMRQLRNNLVHGKTRPIPELLAQRHDAVRAEASSYGIEESEGYVRKSFEVISEAAKAIELAVLDKLHQGKA